MEITTHPPRRLRRQKGFYMERVEKMEHIALQVEAMVNEYGYRKDITITYALLDDESIEEYTEYQRRHHGLLKGDEYFFIWEIGNPYDIDPHHLLYTKCVTGDNALTAAAELMNLVSHKF